jgi:hypothetical protein
MPPPRRRTRKRPSGGKGGSRRGRPGGSANRRSFKEFRDRNKPSPSKRTTTTFDDSGRESGIRAASTTTRADKKKSLEQSIGSLDRRINNAVNANNLDLAKDLRSRQNRFVKNLGYFNATNTDGGVARTNDGRILRTRDGSPVLTNKGLAAFENTVDRDFLDPTRKLINENPQAYAAMYPVTNQLRQGLPGTRVAKEFLGMDDKQQKYTDAQMPGERYALDKDFGAGTGPEIMDDEIIADDFDKSLDVAPDAVPLPDTNVIVREKPQPDDPGFTAFNEFLLGIGDNLKNPDMVDARVRGPEDFTAMTGEQVRFPGSNQFDFSSINNLFRGLGSNLKTTDGARAQGPTERTGFLDMGANLRNQTTSGEDFANQVANNATVMKENISNAPNLNADQKQVLMNEVDRQMTQFQPSSGLDMLTSDAPILLPEVVDQQLNTNNVSRVRGPDDASEAAALEVLNSLDNQNRGFSLSDLFDANPDQQGFQLFNLNPNR